VGGGGGLRAQAPARGNVFLRYKRGEPQRRREQPGVFCSGMYVVAEVVSAKDG
jgi:hypothetical protein